MAYIFFLNKKHETKRVAVGKPAKIIDHSMNAVGEFDVDKNETSHTMPESVNAFRDLTDLENEDFIYVY